MKLSLRHKIFLYSCAAILFITGAVWAAHANELAVPFLGVRLKPDYEWMQFLLSTHGVCAMAYLLALGAMFPVHVRKGWYLKRRKKTGSVFIAVQAILILSAALLYYGSPDGWRPRAEVVHLWGGLSLPFFIVIHVFLAERRPLKGEAESEILERVR